MAPNEAELKGLMIAGLAGDAAAYKSLLERLTALLRGYYKARLARIGRGAADAEDLVQEALMAMHTRRHTYDRDQPLTPWVHAIARYKLIDHLRQTRRITVDLPLDDVEEPMAQDDHISVESAYDLHKLLDRLPEKMRRAIQCVKLDGLSVAEAAERSGMSESAVKVNVHRGLRALATAMRGKNEHEN
jgi:RNA polymerase sigma-70 factor, ECF subfamily